jgi:lipoprotein-anchoring transpeptidase ErfK/SrfK
MGSIFSLGRGSAPLRRARLLHALLAGAALAAGVASLPQSAAARDIVAFSTSVEPGTIVISARQRKLFYVVSPGVAIRYPVAVPRSGKEWSGYASVDGKYVNPDWVPPTIRNCRI